MTLAPLLQQKKGGTVARRKRERETEGKITTSLTTECIWFYGHMLSPRITFTSSTTSRTSTGPSLLICQHRGEFKPQQSQDVVIVCVDITAGPAIHEKMIQAPAKGRGHLHHRAIVKVGRHMMKHWPANAQSSPGRERVSKDQDRTAPFTDDALHIHALCVHYLPRERMWH